jgi:tetratricopeptide (TPR) repeat protein
MQRTFHSKATWPAALPVLICIAAGLTACSEHNTTSAGSTPDSAKSDITPLAAGSRVQSSRSADDRWLQLKKYGEAYYKLKQYKKGEKDLLEATELARQFKQPDRRLPDSLRILSNIYAEEGRKAEAEKGLLEALSICRQGGYPDALGEKMVLQSLFFFYQKDDFKKCDYYAHELLRTRQEILSPGDKRLMEPLWFLAICRQGHKMFADAARYFKKAIDLEGGQIDGSSNELGLCLLGYGQCCVELNRISEADTAFRNYLKWTSVSDRPQTRTDFGPTMRTYYAKTGNRKQAIDFLDTWMKITSDRVGQDSVTYRDALRVHKLIEKNDSKDK